MEDWEDEFDILETDESKTSWWVAWGIAFAIGLFVSSWILGPDKYEGLTAEEWADKADYWNTRYEEFRSCVEDFDSFDLATQISYGGVFYYCE